MADAPVVHLKGDNWKTEVQDSPTPVLVDFWAPWCGPCRMIAPVLDELAVELAGKLKVVKVNVDEHQQIAARFQVRSIPTLLVLAQGRVKEAMSGAVSKAVLREKLTPYL